MARGSVLRSYCGAKNFNQEIEHDLILGQSKVSTDNSNNVGTKLVVARR